MGNKKKITFTIVTLLVVIGITVSVLMSPKEIRPIGNNKNKKVHNKLLTNSQTRYPSSTKNQRPNRTRSIKRKAVFTKDEIDKKNQKLLEIARRTHQEFKRSRGAKYDEYLKNKNNPKSKKIDLIGVDPKTGMPIYYKTLNLDGAKSINTANIWSNTTWNPVTPPAYAINGGSGLLFLGIWDGGSPEVNHIEFGNRITNMDSSSSSDHATHVAGTMVAAGDYVYGAVLQLQIPGMSYGANLVAYDYTDDLSEIASATLPNGLNHGAAGSSQMYLSNHSYGIMTGWNFDGSTSDCSGDWYWYGSSNIDEDEDYKFSAYLSSTRDMDNILYNAPYYVSVWATGNERNLEGPAGILCPKASWYEYGAGETFELVSSDSPNKNNYEGGYDTITPNSSAKNVITVGAVLQVSNYVSYANVVMSDFSSWGPADDGRIKPDVVAPGVDIWSTNLTDMISTSSGTSMASPMIAGSIALLQKLYNNYNSIFPLASTIKALVIHEAREAGPFDGPDYQFGFGLPDIDASAKIIYNDSSADQTNIIESTLSNGETEEHLVRTDGSVPKVTLVWTDPAGSVQPNVVDSRNKVLVNDLNVVLIDDSSTSYYPWTLDYSQPTNPAVQGVNNTDNVEKIEVSQTPASGEIWKIRVSHAGSLSVSQAYSLVFTGLKISTGENKISFTNADSGDSIALSGGRIEVDMGSTLNNGSITKNIRIHNSGVLNLELSSFAITNASVFASTMGDTTIASGGYSDLEVIFNPAGGTGNYISSLTFNTNDTNNPSIQVALSARSDATATSDIKVEFINTSNQTSEVSNNSIISVANRRASPGDSETSKIKISNVGSGNLLLSSFSSMNSPFSWSRPTDLVLATGNSIEYSFNLSLENAGNFTQTVSFTTNVSGKENYSLYLNAILDNAIDAKLSFTGPDGDSVSSGQMTDVFLGSSVVNNTIIKNFIIENNGNVDIDLSSFTISGADKDYFTWDTTINAIQVGNTETLSISFYTDTVREYVADFQFVWKESGTAGNNIFSFPIKINAIGSPRIYVSYNGSEVSNNNNPAIDIGSVSLRDINSLSSNRSLTIQNIGQDKLEIKNISVSTPFVVVQFPSASIMPGEYTELKFKFGQYTPALYSGIINFETNTVDVPIMNINISSKLTSPKITMNYQTQGIYRENYHYYILNSGYEEDLVISNIEVPNGFELYEEGSRTIPVNVMSEFKFRLDTQYGEGYRSGSAVFYTNDPDNPILTVAMVAGNVDYGIVVPVNDDEEKKKSKKNTPVVGCGEIDLDQGGGGPFQKLFILLFGILISFIFTLGRRLSFSILLK